ncbi:MAG TPA: histidinol dehydrogenase [Acidimicrobiales bacterium]|nr:histidinol dehydrogenase [Acidimicrobiales bacterium]
MAHDSEALHRASPDAPLRMLGRWGELSSAARAELAERDLSGIVDDELRAGIVALLDDVRSRGDAAVVDALRRFDGCEVEPPALRVTEDELDAGLAATSEDVTAALRDAIAHVRRFNERICEQGDWTYESEPGLVVGERVSAIESAGLFVPSGKGSFPSVLVQLAVPAIVAGVPTIVVAVPPMPGGGGAIDPAVLAACRLLELDQVFRVNGPAGIAAMAFGTESIPRVRLVVGPGSPAVTCAQLEVQRYGTVTTMVLGPTESLVVADETADACLLAADLLNEAEHGSDSTTLLVTTSATLLADVQREAARQLAALPEPRRTYAGDAIGVRGGAVLVTDAAEAADVANAFAPEHLQLVVRDEATVLDLLFNAGEILVGQQTPFAAANYVLGCPASLPTSGFAKVSSGVTAHTFRKRSAIAQMDRNALRRVTPSVVALARHEGFPAHESAMTMREP